MDIQRINSFKNKISENGVYGIFSKSLDPAFVEVIGYAGIDFVILDMEHGPTSFSELHNNVRAAEVSNLISIVRTNGLDEELIGSALDSGADGVQIPHIGSLEEAKNAVKYAKYHPIGDRGVCRFVRSAKFSHVNKECYFEEANDTLLILQIEGVDAIKQLDEILDVKGIDIIFIGPYDLSQSLGVPGEIENPKVIKNINEIIRKAQSKKKQIGIFADSPDQVRLWRDTGIKYISYSTDVGLFYDYCKYLNQKIFKDFNL